MIQRIGWDISDVADFTNPRTDQQASHDLPGEENEMCEYF